LVTLSTPEKADFKEGIRKLLFLRVVAIYIYYKYKIYHYNIRNNDTDNFKNI
jgi:hypothetical protein